LPETVNVGFSDSVTPGIVKSPTQANVLGPVCTTFVEWNVIKGSCSTSEKIFALQFSVLHTIISITGTPCWFECDRRQLRIEGGCITFPLSVSYPVKNPRCVLVCVILVRTSPSDGGSLCPPTLLVGFLLRSRRDCTDTNTVAFGRLRCMIAPILLVPRR
jgi:hypothetical protein